jgi:tetratricopeptide (TPR) repeat protein
MKRYSFLLAGALLIAGCGLSPEIPDISKINVEKTHDAFHRAVAEGTSEWGKRAEGPDHIRRAVAAFERAAAIDPYDRYSRQYLALALYYIGNYYTTGDEEKEKVHLRGHGWGVEALKQNPKVRAALEKDEMTVEEAAAKYATPGDVPGLYWMSVNLARAVENKGIATRATSAPKLKMVMETIYRLGPTYYWGGVHRFFGAYYIKAPAQKDPLAQSKREFERAIKIGPEDLENFVLYAEYYATAAQDRDLFEKLLRQVANSKPEDDIPAMRLDNAEARKRARKFLEEIDERF